MFTAGFACRVYGSYHYDNIDVYVASQILILCAPPLLELANYHILGRIMYYIPYCAPLHPGRVLTTFGALSFFVEILNGVGVAWISRPDAKQSIIDIGHILMKASLFLQCIVIGLFCVIGAIFWRRCARAGVSKVKAVQIPMITLYTSMALIFIRCVYRLVEHFSISSAPTKRDEDFDPMDLSPIVRWEWYFYTFEAALMLSAIVLWNGAHPRLYLPEKYNVYLAQDGKTELLGPGWKEDRPWLVTFCDPFGWFWKPKKTEQRPFWEENDGSEPLVHKERQHLQQHNEMV
ncbi:hypothetical protein BU24DRAFT_423487 [Aaosphaeria arxii CBS 175.79]|uniref:RTA1 domain protein n=1 Tax=Aaosphaeria arxii CBS 175.79 TaxID=1450172 RepID=A0A6A5XP92_9PLEO|nr:uncharacterized protein BU24DRAFT_423487 [Aaosphaeria arxii CBS 175.79]KAF2014581.1 hypothetical protein BU24DRAFT_423487 [Aaosphaeria arxii CBS 175.79]